MVIAKSTRRNEASKTGLRQRKSRPAEKQSVEKQESSTYSVISQLTTPRLQLRYCMGFLMGLVACVGSIATYEKDDPGKEYKFTAWLFFALIGLYFHETRPFKKF